MSKIFRRLICLIFLLIEINVAIIQWLRSSIGKFILVLRLIFFITCRFFVLNLIRFFRNVSQVKKKFITIFSISSLFTMFKKPAYIFSVLVIGLVAFSYIIFQNQGYLTTFLNEKTKTVSEIESNEKFVSDNDVEIDLESLIAKNDSLKDSIDDINEDIQDITLDIVNFQAIEVDESRDSNIGPFVPGFSFSLQGDNVIVYPKGSSQDVSSSESLEVPFVKDFSTQIEKTLSPAEELRLKQEQRKQIIKDELNSGVTVKGIVIDVDRTNPMAVLEITNPSGSTSVKTVVPGQSIWLANCQAKVARITETKVELVSEGIKVDRKLPEFADEGDQSSGVASSNSLPSMSVPPVAGSFTTTFPGTSSRSGNFASGRPPVPSQISQAKQNDINEIDQLIESF